MTCVVGFNSGNKIYMSCDSEVSNGYTKEHLNYESSKVIKRKGILFGICGSCVLTDLIRYELLIPTHDTVKYSTMAYIHKLLIPSLKRCFRGNNLAEIENNSISMPGELLIGINSINPRLVKVQSDFSCFEITDIYSAIGCGELAALGAMFANITNCRYDADIRANLQTAQRAANHFNSGVDSKIIIKTTDDLDDELGYKEED